MKMVVLNIFTKYTQTKADEYDSWPVCAPKFLRAARIRPPPLGAGFGVSPYLEQRRLWRARRRSAPSCPPENRQEHVTSRFPEDGVRERCYCVCVCGAAREGFPSRDILPLLKLPIRRERADVPRE